jgi:nitroimidazol reductase NimA-like FMN-containing flavoprotein (pyridoxamine 5'-phosphate oxidase superfamily)
VGEPGSERVRVRRRADRGRYDPAVVHAIVDEAVIAHVGVVSDDGPVVLPMALGRRDDTVYLHGSVANQLLRSGDGAEVCVTVTLLDGLVLARSVFHHSMNYRSVVVRGRARRVDDPAEKLDALRCITDHVLARWDDARPPDEAELRQTLVLAVPLTEASAKVRTGDPVDDDADRDGPWWAGTVDMTLARGTPRPAADLAPGVVVPEAVRRYAAGVGPPPGEPS